MATAALNRRFDFFDLALLVAAKDAHFLEPGPGLGGSGLYLVPAWTLFAGPCLGDARTGVMPGEGQGAGVQLLQALALSDVDYGAVRQCLEQQRQQPVLGVDVERGGRLVHHDHLGTLEQ